MSKKDYTKFSKSQYNAHDVCDADSVLEVTYPLPEDDILEEPNIDSTPEPVIEPEIDEQKPLIFGRVANCSKLNVRQYPNLFADILGCLDKDVEIEIDEDKSTNDFYAICTPAGLEGFCLKKFVEICK